MIILIIGYLAALAALGVFIIHPSIARIQTINQDIYQQEVYLEKLYLRGQLIKQVRAQLAEIGPFIEKMALGFVDPKESVKFIETLEKAARDFEILQKIDLRTEERIEKPIYEIMPTHLSLQGDFINLVRFLARLEEIDYYFNIDSISVTSTLAKYKLEEVPVQISVSITAKSYWSRK